MSVEICPVCGGKGLVPSGFYTAIGTLYYSTTVLQVLVQKLVGLVAVRGILKPIVG